MGRAAAELLNPNKIELLAFGDNDPNAVSPDPSVPVLSVEEAAALHPDEFLISVLGEDRAQSLESQVRAAWEDPLENRSAQANLAQIVSSGADNDDADNADDPHESIAKPHAPKIQFLADMYEMFDIRSRCLRHIVERIRRLEVPGDIAELGVYKGDTAWQLNAMMPERTMYLFDTFEGFDDRDAQVDDQRFKTMRMKGAFTDTSEEAVMQRMPHPDKVVICKGWFPETAEKLENGLAGTFNTGEVTENGADDACSCSSSDQTQNQTHNQTQDRTQLSFALVSLDPDLYAPTLEGLRFFYPRLSPGGMIIVHDYDNKQFTGVKQAVSEFEDELTQLMPDDDERIDNDDISQTVSLNIVPLGDLHGTCVIIK